MEHVIRAEGLKKRFGDTQALARVDILARQGTVLGVLGPNGAGKTTAVRVLATLLKPDEGRAEICGYSLDEVFLSVTGHPAETEGTLT